MSYQQGKAVNNGDEAVHERRACR